MPDTDPIGSGYKASTHVDDDLYGLAQSAGETDSPQGYVSDAELMAWLETKSNQQNTDLRDAMGVSTERIKLMQKLNDLKTEIQGTSTREQVETIYAEMQTLVEEYKNTPFAQDVADLFGPAITALDQDGDQVMDDLADAANDGATLGALTERITSETDKLGKIDGLQLVQIQQLVSDAKETNQLASNVFSSRDQTANSIVGNIRG